MNRVSPGEFGEDRIPIRPRGVIQLLHHQIGQRTDTIPGIAREESVEAKSQLMLRDKPRSGAEQSEIKQQPAGNLRKK
jgi:hypothetical protein